MAGRPINESRALAVLMGDKTYVGTVHEKCGTAERYVSGGGCVHCARIIASEQREARSYLLARAAGLDSRGDQGGGYPSSQGPLDKAPKDGLTAAERFAQSIEDDLM